MESENGFFKYVCRYYNEVDKKMITTSGIVYGDSYVDAIGEIEHFYGNLIAYINITGLEAGPPIYEITEEIDNE